MRDTRIEGLARTLIHYSVELKAGERVLISGPELSQPLAIAVYRQALQVGALPTLWATFEEASWALFKDGSDEQLSWLDPLLLEAAKSVDAYIALRAPTNLKLLSNVDPAKQVLTQKARRPFLDVVLNKRWVLCELPTQALAQEAGMALEEFEEFSFGAVDVDWPAMRDELHRRKARLETVKEVRILGKDTDLKLGVAGRVWIPDEGKHNMPGR